MESGRAPGLRAYFDYAATAPPDPRVLEAMLPHLSSSWGNPSGIYREAQQARAALDDARSTVAAVLGCAGDEVVFTSGGTESDNLAVRGAALAATGRGRHIVTSAIEHHAVLHAAEQLERLGFEVECLPTGSEGFVDADDLVRSIRPDTTLVSVMHANNEVGTIQEVATLAAAAKSANPAVLFHTDAVQAAAWLDVDVRRLGVDLLSLSAHKLGGPKGVGALYVHSDTPLWPQNAGGGQEQNRRAGTENVAGAIGLARAIEIAAAERASRVAHVGALSARLIDVLRAIPGCRMTGPRDRDRRLPGLVSCCFEGVAAEDLLIRLDLLGFAASSGSACTTGSLEPSHVLIALGLDERTARGSLRLSVGPGTSMDEVERLAGALPEEIARLRAVGEPFSLGRSG